MPCLRIIVVLCLLPAFAVASPTDEATVAPAKASIYVGRVTLALAPFKRTGTRFETTYTAKVSPLFFFGENGTFWIDLPEADLARLAKGETVTFKGEAENSAHEKRRVEGRVTPKDVASGAIKVRVFVTAKTVIPFETTYRFTGK
jgi:hypothetical protein